MAENIHEVSYELGALKQGLDTVLKTLSEDRLSSAQYRTDIRKQLADNSEQMQNIKGQVASVHAKLTEIVPKVESLEQRALMSKGATALVVTVGKAAHIISVMFGGLIVYLLDRYFGK